MAGYGVEYPKTDDYHGHPNYTKIFIILLVFLVISIAAGYLLPLVPAILVIFITAAIKAGLVITNFMHLKYEPKLVWVALAAFLFIVLALFWGLYPDISIIDLEIAK